MTETQMSIHQQRPAGQAQPDDRELLARLGRRDMDAMSTLYTRYSATVNSLALRITGHPGDAAEIVQEVFTQIWRQASNYEPGRGSVLGWICMITRTRSLDLIRARARRPSLENELPTDENRPQDGTAAGPCPETEVLAGESVDMVRAALTGLSAPERRALELAYFEDLSHTEIAERTGLPLGTVKTHIARAIRKLRLSIEGLQGQEASGR